KKVGGINRGVLLHLLTLGFIPIFFLLVYYPVDFDMSALFGKTEAGEPYIVQLSDIIFMSAAVITLGYLIFEISKATKEEGRKLIAAVILIFMSVLFWSFFEQGGGSLNFFANGNVESH